MSALLGRVLGLRTVRARIALACAALFLVTAGAFVAATYGLVAHNLNAGAVTAPVLPLLRSIEAASRAARACESAGPGSSLAGPLAAQCGLLAAGVRLGDASQGAHDLHEMLLWSLIGLGVATIVAGALGWAIAGHILVPLRRVTAAAQRASREHLDERIRLDGPDDELRELADTFDSMLNRLDLAFTSHRRFVANASHELRTPLTSMHTLIDVAMAKPARTTEQLETLVAGVRQALERSEAIIDGLLTLARSDRGLTTREPLDLEAAAQDALDQTSAAATAANVAVEAALSPAPVRGERVLVERLVANLVDNAIRYNVPGGRIQVETGTDHGQSHLSVANTGPPVPQAIVASLFEPFTRLDQRLTNGQGVGLGLSIVASVAAAHGASLRADALPGGGLKIMVRFAMPS